MGYTAANSSQLATMLLPSPMYTIFLPLTQGLTLVHHSAQRKHILWDTLGAWFPPSLSDRGTSRGVTNTA